MKSYSWKINKYPVSADIAGNTMSQIAENNNGILTAKTVLDESRPEEAPLHPCFEWNDEIAAEKYRLNQSQSLITNLEVHYSEPDIQEQTVAFVNVSSGHNTAIYKETRMAFGNPDDAKVILMNALSDAESLKRKCAKYKRIAETLSEVKTLIREEISML